MWNNFRSLHLSLIILKVAFVAMAAATFLVPAYARWYDEHSATEPVFLWQCVFCYAILALGFAAAISLNSLLANIKKERVFVRDNVRSLRVISYLCFAAGVVFLIYCAVRPMMLLLAGIAGFIGLALRIVKNVFAKAVELREENDAVV